MTKEQYKHERCIRCSYHADCGYRIRNMECDILDGIDAAFEAGRENAAMNPPRTVYICGPVSGLEESRVRENFSRAEASVRDSERIPVSPLNNGLGWDAPWEDHVRASLAMMLKCDSVLALPGWEESRGCKLEITVAKELGMEVTFAQKNTDRI